MSDELQIEAPVDSRVWRFIASVTTADLENVLNDMAKHGYQVYRMDRVEIKVSDAIPLGATGWTHNVTAYDLILFNPVLMGTNHAIGMQQALMKAGLNVGPTSKTGG